MDDIARRHVNEIIEALWRADAYPHDAADIELHQTHISYVFLAGGYAYKLKKPVDYGYLDYTTPERRAAMCEAEVALNRRLCDGVYLGVSHVCRASGGRITIDGEGDVIEHAVRMRRIAAAETLPARMAAGVVTSADMRSVARHIARFLRTAPSGGDIARYGRIEAVRANWDDNFAQTDDFLGSTLQEWQDAALRAYVADFVREQGTLIEERADGACIRDGHGDIRADSVMFGDGGSVCITDCLEFNEALRCGDVAAEAAFLVMDLAARGRQDLADEAAGALTGLMYDETLPVMLPFYLTYRSAIRGKVESAISASPELGSDERASATARARRHFAMASMYASQPRAPMLVVMHGLSGSGKSHLANALAARTGAAIVSSDVTRKRSAGIDPATDLSDRYGGGAYTAERREDVYAAMHAAAAEHLAAGRAVVLDATYISRADRAAALKVAGRYGVPGMIVDVESSDDSVRAHLAARQAEGDAASDAGWAVYREQRAVAEPLDAGERRHAVLVNGADPLAVNLRRVLTQVAEMRR